MVTRNLLLKQKSHLFFITDDKWLSMRARTQLQKEKALFVLGYFQITIVFISTVWCLMVHYSLRPPFGEKKSENNKIALFNSTKP